MLAAPAETYWGSLPLLVDTSAWMRADHPVIRGQWLAADCDRRFRLSPLVSVEVLIAAKDAQAFAAWAQRLSAVQLVPPTATMVRAVEFAIRELASRSAGTHRIPVVDYFVAAAAESLGGAVLHYDRHFDTLAEVMNFESVWLAPPGSIP